AFGQLQPDADHPQLLVVLRPRQSCRVDLAQQRSALLKVATGVGRVASGKRHARLQQQLADADPLDQVAVGDSLGPFQVELDTVLVAECPVNPGANHHRYAQEAEGLGGTQDVDGDVQLGERLIQAVRLVQCYRQLRSHKGRAHAVQPVPALGEIQRAASHALGTVALAAQ